MEDIILKSGNKVLSSQIIELVDTEMDENCHEDYIGDYESELDFYLSNVEKDSYVTHYLADNLQELEEEDLQEIQSIVIDMIRNKF